MSKRDINSVQDAELPATKRPSTTQTAQTTTTTKPVKVSHPISYFGKTTKRGLASENEEPSPKRQCIRPVGETKETVVATKETLVAKANTVEQQFSMDEILDTWFGPNREQIKSLRFTGFRRVRKPIAKKFDLGNIKIDPISHGPRPKIKATRKKTVKKGDFAIFEDDTATRATNLTQGDTKNNSAFQDFVSLDAIVSSTTYIRRGTKTVIQLASWKSANYVIEWLTPLADYLDFITPYNGPGFEGRICNWTYRLEARREEGVPQLRGARYSTVQHLHPDNEEEWFKVEDVEELAAIMEDIHQVVKLYLGNGVLQEGDIAQMREHSRNTLGIIAGYCFTFGGGGGCGWSH